MGTGKDRQLVVLAGGLGTRLADQGIETPKFLLPIGDSSILEILVREAENEGFTEILLCLGKNAELIISAARKIKGTIKIRFSVEPSPLGTFGALLYAREMLNDEFVLLMGDLLIAGINLRGFFDYSLKADVDIAILVKYTDHPLDSDLVEIDSSNRITGIYKYPHFKSSLDSIAMAGGLFLKKTAVVKVPLRGYADLTKDFLTVVVDQLHMIAYFHQGIIRDLGTLDRLISLDIEEWQEKKLENGSLAFLDRDGTLNIQKGYIHSESEIELTPWARTLMKSLSIKFDFIGLVTNQPVVARGECTLEQVESINTHLENLVFQESGKRFDFIEVCPHHPDSGFDGEVVHLKIACTCRKPNPGMILDVLQRYKVRASNAVLIGDSISDLVAAERSGVSWIHIHSERAILDCDAKQLMNGYCLDSSAFPINDGEFIL